MKEYEDAVKVWIVRTAGLDIEPERIKDIEFSTIEEGYCETCAYTTMGIIYTIKGKGDFKERNITMGYDSPAQFVREVSEIYQEMNS